MTRREKGTPEDWVLIDSTLKSFRSEYPKFVSLTHPLIPKMYDRYFKTIETKLPLLERSLKERMLRNGTQPLGDISHMFSEQPIVVERIYPAQKLEIKTIDQWKQIAKYQKDFYDSLNGVQHINLLPKAQSRAFYEVLEKLRGIYWNCETAMYNHIPKKDWNEDEMRKVF